jgi:hypothetical protein
MQPNQRCVADGVNESIANLHVFRSSMTLALCP